MQTQIRSLDTFYSIIDDQIKLVASFTEKKYMDTIIRMCRLKPYGALYGSKKDRSEYRKLKLHKHWVDEFGNSLKIIKNKRTQIILNDPELVTKTINCTDLYDGLPLDKIGKMAKLLYLLADNKKIVIAYVGIDNYLRCYECSDNEWQQISPLQLGIKSLIAIVKNLDIKYYKKLQNKTADEWIGFWPPHKDFLETIKKNDIVSEALKLTKGEKQK